MRAKSCLSFQESTDRLGVQAVGRGVGPRKCGGETGTEKKVEEKEVEMRKRRRGKGWSFLWGPMELLDEWVPQGRKDNEGVRETLE